MSAPRRAAAEKFIALCQKKSFRFHFWKLNGKLRIDFPDNYASYLATHGENLYGLSMWKNRAEAPGFYGDYIYLYGGFMCLQFKSFIDAHSTEFEHN